MEDDASALPWIGAGLGLLAAALAGFWLWRVKER
jgi:LPXTG-motif cell wall-anchored protein